VGARDPGEPIKQRKAGQEAKAFIAAERTRPMGPDNHLEHIAIESGWCCGYLPGKVDHPGGVPGA
jgi:hypothetical protein